MKRYFQLYTICLGMFCVSLIGCNSSNGHPTKIAVEGVVVNTATEKAAPVLENTVTPEPIATLLPTDLIYLETLQPTFTSTPTPIQILFPDVTLSQQESEVALLELLRTNGNCTGKCLAGIRPDEMNVQEAVDVMTQWGMVSSVENFEGNTFIILNQDPLYEQVTVYLSVGTWTKKLETIDRVAIRIEDASETYLDDGLWLTNQETWQGFQLDGILETYGLPSYIGYFFQTDVEIGAPLEGRTISYAMELHYVQTNMKVHIGALAYYDGENLFVCPANDPHNVGIWINPERALIDAQEFYPVTWEALTGMDTKEFYQMFTDETNPDACVITTLEQIQALQPWFR